MVTPLHWEKVKRYTGLAIYNRPHAPILVIGCLAMLFGLVWHFYFRHRDRKGNNDNMWERRLAAMFLTVCKTAQSRAHPCAQSRNTAHPVHNRGGTPLPQAPFSHNTFGK